MIGLMAFARVDKNQGYSGQQRIGQQPALWPPSTLSVSPVTKSADSRNITASTMS
jgi:hypothetical protein